MPSVKFIDYAPARVIVSGGTLVEIASRMRCGNNQTPAVIKGFPQVYFSDGRAWDFANLWAASHHHSIVSGGKDLSTLVSSMYALRDLADCLERIDLPWTSFPIVQSERVLFRYHGDLCGRIKRGEISVNVGKQRMRAAIKLYGWSSEQGLFSSASDLLPELSLSVRIENIAGLLRTLAVSKDQLKIRGARSLGNRVEDGLLPVSIETQDYILSLAFDFVSSETYLMLALGFYTGMRIQSICDLKVLTFQYARMSGDKSAYYLSVGPAVKYAPVATKFSVNGEVIIPVALFDLVKSYIGCKRRLTRAAKSNGVMSDLVFLNKSGLSYVRKGKGGSSNVNAEIAKLRMVSIKRGRKLDFKFHQTRATFGTNFVVENLDRPGVSLLSVIGTLKGLMLHKDELTTMKYVKFVQNHRAQAKWSDEFTRKSLELRKKW